MNFLLTLLAKNSIDFKDIFHLFFQISHSLSQLVLSILPSDFLLLIPYFPFPLSLLLFQVLNIFSLYYHNSSISSPYNWSFPLETELSSYINHLKILLWCLKRETVTQLPGIVWKLYHFWMFISLLWIECLCTSKFIH